MSICATAVLLLALQPASDPARAVARPVHYQLALPPAGFIDTIAGGPRAGPFPALTISQRPWALAAGGGKLFVGDTMLVRSVDLATGDERVLAGLGEGEGERFAHVGGLAVDGVGNVYVVDNLPGSSTMDVGPLSNFRIARIAPDGAVTTVAGTGRSGYSGDGGPATSAQIGDISSIAATPAGDLYIGDGSFNVVRKIDRFGTITTIAGGAPYGTVGENGPATGAYVGDPRALAVDPAGNVFFSDPYSGANGPIRVVDPSGTITTVPGFLNVEPYIGLVDVQALAADRAGNLLVSQGSWLYERDPAGTVTTIAGTGTCGPGGDGGPAQLAQVCNSSLAVDESGRTFLDGANTVREIDTAGIIDTIAGNGFNSYSGDGGNAMDAQFSSLHGIVRSRADDLYVSDVPNHVVRKIDVNGVVTTFAGDPRRCGFPAETGDNGDGGPATAARICYPAALALDSAGNLHIAEQYGGRVRRVDDAGIITTVAGNGTRDDAGDGGPATDASFLSIEDIAIDASDNLYLSDERAHRVRRVDGSGIITTLAGTGGAGSSPAADGSRATTADLLGPRALAVDPLGGIVFVDKGAPDPFDATTWYGTIRTVDGRGILGTYANGLDWPLGELAFDPAGNLFVAGGRGPMFNVHGSGVCECVIRRVDPAGDAQLIAGERRIGGYAGDGGPAVDALIGVPADMTFDRAGNLFFPQGDRIRVIAAVGSTGPARPVRARPLFTG